MRISGARKDWVGWGSALLLWALPFSARDARAAPEPSAPAPGVSASAKTTLDLRVPASAEQRGLVIELASDGLWFASCVNASCAARTGQRIELPPDAAAAVAGARLEALELAGGRRAAHVRIPLADGAFEALLAAGLGNVPPLVIFAGKTGALNGEDGLRQGDLLWVREGDGKGQRVLVGKVREDVQLCGRPTILEPRLLDRDLSLRAAKVQQLSLEERRAARVIHAVRQPEGPTRGGNALRALAASSALGDPQFLTDGRADTSWSEGRGGDGRGEFVLLRPLSGTNLIALEFLVRPDGEAPADAGAPHSLWVASRDTVYRVDFDEDAWKTPGVWYRAAFPAPVSADCLALVLENSFTERAERRVTFAEVHGVSELQALEPAELVARLSTPGEAGAAAVPALLQAGAAGLEALVGAFGALDATGRSRALDVLEVGSCNSVAGVYVALLGDADPRNRRRAEQRLRGCGPAAWDELRKAFEASSGQLGEQLGQSIAEIAPALAVELIAVRLAAAAPEQRAHYRDALHRAALHPEAETPLRRLLAGNTLGAGLDLDVLRALGELLPHFRPEASQAFARVATSTSFEQRFSLLGPAALLAATHAGARTFIGRALGDPDPYLRAAAARSAPDLPELQSALLARTRDAEVRVREASVLRLGELALPAAASSLSERLKSDTWPLVRVAAAEALAGYPAGSELDTALAAALTDPVPPVRAASLHALGRRGARAEEPLILARFTDAAEAPPVRAAAAAALGQLCAQAALEPLTQAAWRLASERPSPDDLLVGAASVAALGQLHPADLVLRLGPLLGKKQAPVLGHLVAEAQLANDHCGGAAYSSALPPRTPTR